MGERNGTVTSKQALILSTCYSNKSSDGRKQATNLPLSTRISKTYRNIIIKFKWCGSSLTNQQISAGIFRYLAVSSDICGYLQVSGGIFRYLQASSDIWRYLQVSAGIFRYLAVSSGICRHLQISAGIFRYLQIPPTHQPNIDLSHGIYRKPAAAARHP